MTDFPIEVNDPTMGPGDLILSHYSAAALTAAAAKWEWIVPFKCVLKEVICDSEAAGSGGTSDIIDVNKNGTTVYTTQDNRPTLLVGDTGEFTQAGKPEVTKFNAGDIVSYDVDQVATTGSTRFKIMLRFGRAL